VWIYAGTDVYSALQQGPGSDNWTPFTSLGRVAGLPWLAASQVGDTGAQLWMLAGTSLHSTHQDTASAAWTPWDPALDRPGGWEGSGPLAAVAAAHQRSGDTTLWAVDSAGKLRTKSWVDGHWQEWSTPF